MKTSLGFALRESLGEGYGLRQLRADLLAGAVVGVVALPLAMALAIASGVPPQHGLYTVIVAAPLIALLGGSRVQVSGPTAAFVVILAPIAARFGIGGLLLATFMAGWILMAMGAAGLGRLIEFVPYPVTTGFTAGIAVVIGTLQVKGAIESLLSAVVADGMTGRQHDPDVELMAQGAGNVVAPFFGGIAATGAIARTATNVRSGAVSPIAAVAHAVLVLGAVLLFAPLLGHLPMASLAALLLVVAWNMSESKHFVHLLRTAPRADILVLLLCFGLTVVFDMVVAVTAGIVLAALLFIKRMAEVSGVTLVGSGHPALAEPLPRSILLYDIAGPLFFGAAQKAMSALRAVERRDVRVVVLDMEHVPAMDATGILGLESLVRDLNGARIKVILVGIQGQPLRALARAGWRNRKGRLRIFGDFGHGIEVARRTVESPPEA